MKSYAVGLAIVAMLLGLAPPLSAQQTIEETYSAFFYIDGRGNATHQVIVNYLPSPYADYLKSMPETLKNQTVVSLQSDYAPYGWAVKNANCEVSGLGAGENLQIAATCEIPSLASWNENRWTISIRFANPESAAQYIINKWNAVRTVLLSFGDNVQYIENGELVFVLPEGAEILNWAELENSGTERIEYGGGSYTETSLCIEERKGRPTIVKKTQNVITTENITIGAQELAENISETLVIEYSVPPQTGNYLLYVIIGVMLAVILVAAVKFRRKK